MNIKSIFTIALAVTGIIFTASPAIADEAEMMPANGSAGRGVIDSAVRAAIQNARGDIAESLKKSRIPTDKTSAIFYIEGDTGDTVKRMIQNVFYDLNRPLVVPNDDENKILNKIYEEMEWDERKTGMLNPGTIEKINASKLMSTQILIIGNVNVIANNDMVTHVEISLDAVEIQTKLYLWSDTFECREYKESDSKLYLSTLPVEFRETLQVELSAKFVESLKADADLKNIKNIAAVSFVNVSAKDGDAIEWERYARHIILDAINDANMTSVELPVNTLKEARAELKANPKTADGIMWSALRSVKIDDVERISILKVKFEIILEVQAQIEDRETGRIIWSDSILIQKDYIDEQNFFDWIFKGYSEELGDARTMGSLALRVVAGVVCLIVFCIVIGIIKSLATRVR